MPRVPVHAAHVLRGKRVQEVEAEEVEARLRRHAALVHRYAVPVEDRDIDPAVVLPEARAPDHVRDVENAAVLEHGEPVLHCDGPRSLLDTCRLEVVRLDADPRRAAREDVRSHLTAERRLDREHVRGDEPEHGHDDAAQRVLDAKRDLPLVGTGEPRPVRLRNLHRDVRPRVAGADQQHLAGLQLRRTPVLARVHLHDARLELGSEPGDVRRPVEAGRGDDAVGGEPLPGALHDVASVDLR